MICSMDLATLYRGRITQTPGVLAGKPVVAGTRISVDLVVGCFAGGMSEADVLTDYPHLTRDDLRACLAYAADALRGQVPIGSAA
jgi:uncharacterized protein (DUF433 family)